MEKNERVTPFSSGFWKKAVKNITPERILAYPEPEGFYRKLSKFYGMSAGHFVLTAGSDAAIRNGFDLCVKPGDAVVTLKPTFAMVEVYCELYNAKKDWFRIIGIYRWISMPFWAVLIKRLLW